MTEDDAARVLNVSKGTLRNWRSQGKGPPVSRIGSAVRYDPGQLREYVSVRTRFAIGREKIA
ncbi:helix-turn-helix domain-containing protein [Roseiarcus fermentans]|uniref:helix-turn-helix domain-containing protein n=1 Tax=Roseiarcus fermentans TaxID=1473586 RepID=UPI001AED0E57|nr:helix-turn-helix domain-containing protein [Roseiarcus fermentans]